MKKNVPKEDYRPVVYGALIGVLMIVLFSVLYNTQVGKVGVAFGALAGDPTIANVMASIDSDSTGVIPVVGANSGPELNQIASRFTGTFGIAEISRKDDEVNPTDADLVALGTISGNDYNLVNSILPSGWDCANDKAIIKVDESGDGLKLLIEGTDLAGLDTAIHILENYQNYDLNANCVKVLSDNSIVPCLFVTRDLPDTIEQGTASTITLTVDADDYTTVFKSFAIHEDFPDGTAVNLQSSGPGYGGQTPTDYVDILYFDINQNPARDSVITYDFTPSSTNGSFSGYVIDTTGAYDGCPILGEQFTVISAECSIDSDCDDNNACTADSCAGGSCVFTAISGCCAADSDCDDNDICTVDTCSNNVCSNTQISGCCITDSDCQSGYSCNTQTNSCEQIMPVLTLKSAFDEIKAAPANFKTVIGGQAPTEDNLASLDVNGKFRITNTVIDDVVTDPLNENLIIIGGPCANKAAGIVMNKPWVGGAAAVDCADSFTANQGMLNVYENNGFKQVIIAGFTGMDTRVAARIVVDYENKNLDADIANTGGTLNTSAII